MNTVPSARLEIVSLLVIRDSSLKVKPFKLLESPHFIGSNLTLPTGILFRSKQRRSSSFYFLHMLLGDQKL